MLHGLPRHASRTRPACTPRAGLPQGPAPTGRLERRGLSRTIHLASTEQTLVLNPRLWRPPPPHPSVLFKGAARGGDRAQDGRAGHGWRVRPSGEGRDCSRRRIATATVTTAENGAALSHRWPWLYGQGRTLCPRGHRDHGLTAPLPGPQEDVGDWAGPESGLVTPPNVDRRD